MTFKEKLDKISEFAVKLESAKEMLKDYNSYDTNESIIEKANIYYRAVKMYSEANPESEIGVLFNEAQKENMFDLLIIRRIAVAIYESKMINGFLTDTSLENGYKYQSKTYETLVSIVEQDEPKMKM